MFLARRARGNSWSVPRSRDANRRLLGRGWEHTWEQQHLPTRNQELGPCFPTNDTVWAAASANGEPSKMLISLLQFDSEIVCDSWWLIFPQTLGFSIPARGLGALMACQLFGFKAASTLQVLFFLHVLISICSDVKVLNCIMPQMSEGLLGMRARTGDVVAWNSVFCVH